MSRKFWLRDDLSMGAKAAGAALCAFADGSGEAWPTIPQIAAALKLSETTAEKYLDELKAAGVLAWSLSRDALGRQRRKYLLAPGEAFIKPSDWDGLGGKSKDGRRTMLFQPKATG